jgi:hypothetical protein
MIWLIFLAGIVICFASAQGAQNSNLTGTIIEGQIANLEGFKMFVCHFRVIWHKASNLENAKNRVFKPGSVTSQCLWARDGDRIIFDLKCDPAIIEQLNNPSSDNKVPCADYLYMSDGNYTFSSGYLIPGASIRRLPEKLPLPMDQPFNINQPYMLSGLDEVKTKQKLSFASSWVDRTEKLIQVEVREQNKQLLHRAIIDPAKGYLPSEHHWYMDEQSRIETCRVLEWARFNTNYWMPKHIIKIMSPDDLTSEFRVHEYIVDHLAYTKPPESLFRVDLPEGYQYSITGHPDASFVPKNGIHCQVSELPQQYEMLLEVGEKNKPRRQMFEKIEAQRTGYATHSYWWFISLGILALGGWLAVRYVRKRKQMAA